MGYYITREGIQPNPEKVVDLLDTMGPRNLKEMQPLNGKITALGRFIARLMDKAISLFQTLKGCIDKRNFKWMREAEHTL